MQLSALRPLAGGGVVWGCGEDQVPLVGADRGGGLEGRGGWGELGWTLN